MGPVDYIGQAVGVCGVTIKSEIWDETGSAAIAAALCERRPQGPLQLNNCIWLTDGHAHAQNLSGHITPHSIVINDLNQDMPGESSAGGNGGAICRFGNRSK